MTDEPKTSLRDSWDRVRWARLRKFPTAAEAARAMGMGEHTYRQYERPPQATRQAKLNVEYAQRFARMFGVNWSWLLTGQGAPVSSDPQLAMLMEIFSRIDQPQRDLLLSLAENMAQKSNVVTVDTLPSSAAPRPLGDRGRRKA